MDLATAVAGAARDWPSWHLTPSQLRDLELLLAGACAPLRGYMARADHEAVCHTMRLTDGTRWPIPLTLDVAPEFAATVVRGRRVALRHPAGHMLAILHVDSVWRPDRTLEARAVYGTTNPAHPGVASLLGRKARPCLSGRVSRIWAPMPSNSREPRRGPASLREEFARRGWTRLAAVAVRA